MADTKITALTAITTVDPAVDVLPIVDISDTTMAASGTTKKITSNQILGAGGTATLASATITGDLTVDTNVLKVDSANNRVGIGTASPTSKLHVFGSGTNTFLTISDVGANYNITLGTQNADIAQLAIFNTTIASGSKDFWLTALSHTFNTWNGSAYSNRFVIASDGVATWSNVGGVAGTAMTLNSTGLGVGGSPTAKISCAGYSSANQLADINIVRSSSGTAIQTGPNIVFTDGTSNNTVTIQNSQGRFGIWNYGAGAWNERLSVDSSGNVGVGVTPSGSGGRLQLKSGITFPATQVASSDANTLDDYKESTWTPTITAGTGTPTTVTVNAANYTKIGRVVVVNIDFSVVAIGTAAGSLTFTLPFSHSGSSIPCGAFRENVSTGNMGQIYYGSATTASCLMYNNATPWVNGYRIQGTYTYFSA